MAGLQHDFHVVGSFVHAVPIPTQAVRIYADVFERGAFAGSPFGYWLAKLYQCTYLRPEQVTRTAGTYVCYGACPVWVVYDFAHRESCGLVKPAYFADVQSAIYPLPCGVGELANYVRVAAKARPIALECRYHVDEHF